MADKSSDLHKGHRERMRKKFLNSELGGFEPHEILEVLLFYSIPRSNTNEIAHQLMNKFHTFNGVFDAEPESLKEIKGISDASVVLIKIIQVIVKEYILAANKNISMSSYNVVCDFFKAVYIGKTKEIIHAALLDEKLKLISVKAIAEGEPGSVKVEIKKLAKYAINNNSDNIIIAHNHPNGDITPSDEDIRSTNSLQKSLESLGINLLDHIIVAGFQAISLKEYGAM